MTRAITIEVLEDGHGFTIEWATVAGVHRKQHAANRALLGRIVVITAVPEIRGTLPRIDEVIDIHAPQTRRAGDA